MQQDTVDDFIGHHLEDPYPRYSELRESAAVHELPDGSHLISRYDDVLAALRDHPRFASGGARTDGMAELSIISKDPPAHARMRHLVTGPFRPAAIAALEDDLRQVTEQLVDDLVAANRDGRADLVDQLAAPLPVIAIARMMGIPEHQWSDFRRWSDASVAQRAGLDADEDEIAEGRAAMASFFDGIIKERRASPGDDLISSVLAGDDPLDDLTALVFCFTLLVAGNETTTNLIGNAAMALLADTDQRDRLWDEPALIPAAMEEALRFDPPAQAITRRATEDVTIDGQTIPAESIVSVLLAGANRDPRHYDDPDRFDIDRAPRDHLGFGHGIHLCLGAHLARLEARLAYEELARRTTDLRHAGPVVRQLGQLRGIRSMPVTFEER